MKKVIIFIITASLALPAQSQFEKHDISLSYGVVTVDQIVDVFEDILVTVFTLGNFEKDDYAYTGAIFLTYKKTPSYRWVIGGTAGIDAVRGNLMWNDEFQGTFRESHYTLAVETGYKWIKQPVFQMYSGIGLGYTFTNNYAEYINNETESINAGHHVTGQLTLLGMRLGKKIGAFAEIGFGYKGILNFGASYQF